jgi:hypothetical protein
MMPPPETTLAKLQPIMQCAVCKSDRVMQQGAKTSGYGALRELRGTRACQHRRVRPTFPSRRAFVLGAPGQGDGATPALSVRAASPA